MTKQWRWGRISEPVRHADLAAWVEHMKGVYQRAIDSYATEATIDGRELKKIRNHLKALAGIQQMISEHHEFAVGRAFDAGGVGLSFRSEATLIKPNGEVIQLKRSEK